VVTGALEKPRADEPNCQGGAQEYTWVTAGQIFGVLQLRGRTAFRLPGDLSRDVLSGGWLGKWHPAAHTRTRVIR
jgi:hypothetical protein